MRAGKWVVIILMVFMFLGGLSLLLLPLIHGNLVTTHMKEEVEIFYEQLETETEPQYETVPAPETTDPTTPSEESTIPTEEIIPIEHEDLWNAMLEYNQQIWEEKQSGLCDPWSYEQPSFELEDYGLEDEVFGVISIPKLDLEMPIYLGATYQHMARGAAHLTQTSLPIGGLNTNCVIAGHRGWGSASYFRYITELELGDKVIITNLWETLTYVVVETRIIDPNDVEEILIQEGKDMITLLTCHPYASGGKQRYLIFCERVIEET